MDRFIVILGIVILCIIGLIRKLLYIKDLDTRQKFVVEYNNKFVDLINKKFKGTFDQINYTWLMQNVHKMHYELGEIGYVDYIDRLKGIKVTHHPLLVNFLSEVQQEEDMTNSIIAMRISDSAKTCSDMFIRHTGDLNEWKEQTEKEKFNPFSLFAEGFRYIIQLPVNCLHWLGLLSFDTASKIKSNILIRIIEKIGLLFTCLATVITIIIGWKEFIEIITNLFSK
ncbi:hypothetical protein FMM68_11980 [Lachnospiraceae bacterium MD329]|nr:hypothetical protein [Lachnospiraceae bacterium MD329]